MVSRSWLVPTLPCVPARSLGVRVVPETAPDSASGYAGEGVAEKSCNPESASVFQALKTPAARWGLNTGIPSSR